MPIESAILIFGPVRFGASHRMLRWPSARGVNPRSSLGSE
jgi:hypothetical protein